MRKNPEYQRKLYQLKALTKMAMEAIVKAKTPLQVQKIYNRYQDLSKKIHDSMGNAL